MLILVTEIDIIEEIGTEAKKTRSKSENDRGKVEDKEELYYSNRGDRTWSAPYYFLLSIKKLDTYICRCYTNSELNE